MARGNVGVVGLGIMGGAFARNLSRLTDLPIAFWDERLSTAAVERELIGADMSRRKRAKVIDQHAAAYILQGALDRLSG